MLQISSSLSTPSSETSSGMGMFSILHISEIMSAWASSQQNNATGLGSSRSQRPNHLAVFLAVLSGLEGMERPADALHLAAVPLATFVRPDDPLDAEKGEVTEQALGKETGCHQARALVVAGQIRIGRTAVAVVLQDDPECSAP